MGSRRTMETQPQRRKTNAKAKIVNMFHLRFPARAPSLIFDFVSNCFCTGHLFFSSLGANTDQISLSNATGRIV